MSNSSARIMFEGLERARARASCDQMHNVCVGMAQGFSTESKILGAASVAIQDALPTLVLRRN